MADGLYGYICMWGGKRLEVYAKTIYAAQQQATAEFQKGTRKKIKEWDVIVVLAERPDGTAVVHTADF